MAEDWDAIAAEIAVAIESVGFEVTFLRPGSASGPVYAPVPGVPTEHVLYVIDDNVKVRDQSGTLVGETVRILTVASTGFVPNDSDRVTVRGVDYDILEVNPTAPGGVDLLYDVTLRT